MRNYAVHISSCQLMLASAKKVGLNILEYVIHHDANKPNTRKDKGQYVKESHPRGRHTCSCAFVHSVCCQAFAEAARCFSTRW